MSNTTKCVLCDGPQHTDHKFYSDFCDVFLALKVTEKKMKINEQTNTLHHLLDAQDYKDFPRRLHNIASHIKKARKEIRKRDEYDLEPDDLLEEWNDILHSIWSIVDPVGKNKTNTPRIHSPFVLIEKIEIPQEMYRKLCDIKRKMINLRTRYRMTAKTMRQLSPKAPRLDQCGIVWSSPYSCPVKHADEYDDVDFLIAYENGSAAEEIVDLCEEEREVSTIELSKAECRTLGLKSPAYVSTIQHG
jgi:hypothetical protein